MMGGAPNPKVRPLPAGAMDPITRPRALKTYTIGNQVFAIFDTADKGGIWMVQLIWGKKDFRSYLSRRNTAPQAVGHAVLKTAAGEELVMSRLQYLYNFAWYDFVKVADHGLASEKVQFRKERESRYVELPKDFYDIAVEIACREFTLERTDKKARLAS
jgi:hypothetical protein